LIFAGLIVFVVFGSAAAVSLPKFSSEARNPRQ
jgi:hypothetical protein